MAYTRRSHKRHSKRRRRGGAATKKVSGSSLEKKLKTAENKRKGAKLSN